MREVDTKEAVAQFERVEREWRSHVTDHGFGVQANAGESSPHAYEVGLFAFGMMASIVRSARAVFTLTEAGFAVESRPIFRSVMDQIIALFSVEAHRVHAVHAYGLELAENYRRLLEASADGFPLGDDSVSYIERFVAMADAVPVTPDGNRAKNAIKTKHAAQAAGDGGALIYQLWLEATPLSKPSMRLADAYITPQPTRDGLRFLVHLDSDNQTVVDVRPVLAMAVPRAITTFATVVGDTLLEAKMRPFLAWKAEAARANPSHGGSPIPFAPKATAGGSSK